jgi:hypothetical protein
MKTISLLLIFFLVVITVVWADSVISDAPICRAVNAAYYGPDVEMGVWSSDAYGWSNIPVEALQQEPILLYTDDTMTAGYALYIYGGKAYIFPHASFEYRADANGEHGGTHDLCDVLIYDLNPEHR